MKHNWTYKKLGEVAIIRDGSHNPPKGQSDETIFRMLSSQNIFDNGIDYSKGVRYLSQSDYQLEHKRSQIKAGDVLLTIVGTIGRACIVKEDDKNITLQRSVAVLSPYEDVLSEFLKFYLQAKSEDLQKESRGVAQKGIYLGQLTKLSLPIPSLSEQQAIVRELDGINRLIDLQEEQLREYDRLAQSLFYTTFGDPVSNPKGWEVKKLGDVCKFSQGMQAPIEEQFEECKEGYTQFLRIIDFTQGKDAPRYVKCTDEKYILHDGEIAIVRYGTPGFVCYGKRGAIANNLFKITPVDHNLFVYDYLRYWLQTDAFQQTVKGNQYGAALQAIKFNTISSIATILPPLALQQSFAAQIETIEQQKALVRKSLDETRTLLAARMQHYFE